MALAESRVNPTQIRLKMNIWGDLVIRKSRSTLVLAIWSIESIANVSNGADKSFMLRT